MIKSHYLFFLPIKLSTVNPPEVSHLTEQEVLIADEVLLRIAAPVADVDRHAAISATEIMVDDLLKRHFCAVKVSERLYT